MKTPYGTCGHTHYEGSPPCIHTAYARGFEDGRRRQALAELVREAREMGLYEATDRMLTDEQQS